MNIKNAIKHFMTITRHRNCVIKHCARSGILWQGIMHDMSKYSPTEFLQGVKFYQGMRSPNEAEREEYGYSLAWIHHKGRNKHHFEYWTDYNPKTKQVEPVKMPYKYVAEMFCDRVAASKIYNGKNYTDDHSIEYFLRGKENRFIHPETSDEIEFLLRMLAEKGEDSTFKYLRSKVKEEKRKQIN